MFRVLERPPNIFTTTRVTAGPPSTPSIIVPMAVSTPQSRCQMGCIGYAFLFYTRVYTP
jgi:hypothetical protein